jgi:hypothetical protein
MVIREELRRAVIGGELRREVIGELEERKVIQWKKNRRRNTITGCPKKGTLYPLFVWHRFCL